MLAALVVGSLFIASLIGLYAQSLYQIHKAMKETTEHQFKYTVPIAYMFVLALMFGLSIAVFCKPESAAIECALISSYIVMQVLLGFQFIYLSDEVRIVTHFTEKGNITIMGFRVQEYKYY